MLNFTTLMLMSENPKALAEFYKQVFQKDPEWEMGDYSGFGVGNGMIMVGPHDKVHGKNPSPERTIFNFETPDVEEEFKRIKELGAEVIAEPYHPREEEQMLLATFADPDGNYFQLASPMDMEPISDKN